MSQEIMTKKNLAFQSYFKNKQLCIIEPYFITNHLKDQLKESNSENIAESRNDTARMKDHLKI